MKKFYEVRRYYKDTLFDSNLNLVYRWKYLEKSVFTDKKKAVKYFTACNYWKNEKAVLRVKYAKGGRK